MKITVEFEHRDIASAPKDALDDLMLALRTVALSSFEPDAKAEETKPPGKPSQNAQTARDETKKAKTGTTATPAAKPAEKASDKATGVKADKTSAAPVKETPAPAAEPEPEPEKPATAETPEAAPAAAPATVPDRRVILDKAKEVATSGKAAEVKEIILSYGITKLSEFPDDKLGELYARIEALTK